MSEIPGSEVPKEGPDNIQKADDGGGADFGDPLELMREGSRPSSGTSIGSLEDVARLVNGFPRDFEAAQANNSPDQLARMLHRNEEAIGFVIGYLNDRDVRSRITS